MTERANHFQGFSPEHFNNLNNVFLPSHLGMRVISVEPGRIVAELDIEQHHRAPNGYLHAGTIVTLADTAAGYGCVSSLPEGASNFTTIELKSNFLATVSEGTICCDAQAIHSGRSTQLWDAVVSDKVTGRKLALFRCTQMIMYPR